MLYDLPENQQKVEEPEPEKIPGGCLNVILFIVFILLMFEVGETMVDKWDGSVARDDRLFAELEENIFWKTLRLAGMVFLDAVYGGGAGDSFMMAMFVLSLMGGIGFVDRLWNFLGRK